MIGTRQRALVRDVEHQLVEAAPEKRALEAVVPELRRLIEADHACAFLMRGRRVEFCYVDGLPAALPKDFADYVASAPRGFSAYDPGPDPRQRNVALRSADVIALNGGKPHPIVRAFFPRYGLDKADQLRVLVCDGDELLAWVGGFRRKPFTEPEMLALDRLVRPLQRRLTTEQQLRDASLQGADVASALEAVPSAAFIVGEDVAILHANAAGRALLETVAAETRELIAAVIHGHDVLTVRLAKLSPRTWLAVIDHRTDPTPLVVAARQRWNLTPRQADVLRLVGRGLSNRAVAHALGCAESTVELHVTALLDKAQCESRAELVAKLWSGA